MVLKFNNFINEEFGGQSIKVYVLQDNELISFVENDDIDGFADYINNEEYLDIAEPLEFKTEEEALAFCSGLGFGIDDRGSVEKLPLRSFEESDIPFIEVIESNL